MMIVRRMAHMGFLRSRFGCRVNLRVNRVAYRQFQMCQVSHEPHVVQANSWLLAAFALVFGFSGVHVWRDNFDDTLEKELAAMQRAEVKEEQRADKREEMEKLLKKAQVYDDLDDMDQSQGLRREALEIALGFGERSEELAQVLYAMGHCYRYKMHKHEDAIRYFNKAIGIRRALGDQEGLGRALIGRGHAQRGLQRYGQAMKSLQEARQVAGSGPVALEAYRYMGVVKNNQNQHVQAMEFHLAALQEACRVHGDDANLAHYVNGFVEGLKKMPSGKQAMKTKGVNVLVEKLGKGHQLVVKVKSA